LVVGTSNEFLLPIKTKASRVTATRFPFGQPFSSRQAGSARLGSYKRAPRPAHSLDTNQIKHTTARAVDEARSTRILREERTMYPAKPADELPPAFGVPVGGPGAVVPVAGPGAVNQLWSSGLFDCLDDSGLCKQKQSSRLSFLGSCMHAFGQKRN
jgi:hypothetical protein